MAKRRVASIIGLMLSAALILSVALVTAKNDTNFAGNLEHTTMRVANLSCPSCIGRIESELKKIPGMAGVSTNLRNGIVEAVHEPALDPAEIAKDLSAMGYPAQIISSKMISKKDAASFGNQLGSFCGPGGCNGPQNCGAAGSAWKELYNRFFNK